VNGFLQALNSAFPRTQGRGPRTVSREVAGNSAAALQQMFPGHAQHFHHINSALQEHSGSGAGTLTLVSTGPNLVWEQSQIGRSFTAAIDEASRQYGSESGEVRGLMQGREAARTAHREGRADWHNVVVYVYRRRTYVYDPSAISYANDTGAGVRLGQQLQSNSIPGEGIEANAIAHIEGARRLWRSGFDNSNRGARLGRRSNAAGAWIGGGGNVYVNDNDAGDCRSMCGDFLVVVHVLQWLGECGGGEMGLSEQQRQDAEFNLDWLVGGCLSGSSNERAMERNMRLQWVRMRMH
jgi:hypothetical protein